MAKKEKVKAEKAPKEQKAKKPIYKRVWFWIVVVLFLIGAISSCVGGDSGKETNVSSAEPVTAEETNSLYANAEIVDLMNSTGAEKIGTFTLCKAKQADCTEEALTDWYFNFVKNNSDSNYHIIVYSDNPQKGVYSIGSGSVQKDISLISEGNNNYYIGDDAGSSYYVAEEDTKSLALYLVMADESVVEEVSSKIDAVIPNEYKNSQYYSVDVSGVEGELDCNLTLVNDGFAKADFQKIATDLAKSIKELDLGIGYFSIAFQSDDYTLTAVSSLDNLGLQDVSEITTNVF